MAKTIGERIRELRNERGLTQKELGERAGIAEPAWPCLGRMASTVVLVHFICKSRHLLAQFGGK